MSLRIGVLGASRIAELAIVGPARELGHRLVAVAARDPQRARAFAEKHGVERVLTSYADVIGDPEVDVVYNPLANSLHARWNLAAVAAGKPVLTEKPFARDREEAQRVADAADAAGVTVMEGFHYLISSGHPPRPRPGRRRQVGRLGPYRGPDGHARAGGRRPEVVTRAGRWRADGPRLLRPARHATAGPSVGHPGARRTTQPGRRCLVRRRARVPLRGNGSERQLDGGRRLRRSPCASWAPREMCWCTTSSSHTRTTG